MPGCKEGHGFGGVKVGARHAHVGQGLRGVGISGSNGSRWSAATWLDNRCNSHFHCLRLHYETHSLALVAFVLVEFLCNVSRSMQLSSWLV